MQASDKEVKIDLCYEHRNLDLQQYYPGFCFNQQISFPPKECKVSNCKSKSYYVQIGLKIPNSPCEMGEIPKLSPAAIETFEEASYLLGGEPAGEALLIYLRTRILPGEEREFIAVNLINKFGGMILNKLNIDPNKELAEKDKHRIVKELDLYPID